MRPQHCCLVASDMVVSGAGSPESVIMPYRDIDTNGRVLHVGAIILSPIIGKIVRNHRSNTLVQSVNTVLCE